MNKADTINNLWPDFIVWAKNNGTLTTVVYGLYPGKYTNLADVWQSVYSQFSWYGDPKMGTDYAKLAINEENFWAWYVYIYQPTTPSKEDK